MATKAKASGKPSVTVRLSGARDVSITNTSTETYAETKGNRTSTSTDSGMQKKKPSIAVPMGKKTAVKRVVTKGRVAAKGKRR